MKLTDLRDLLKTTNLPVYHYFAQKQAEKYIVWAEDGEDTSLNADNEKNEQVIQGTIDYYTKKEYDPNFNTIQNVLKTADLTWRLNSIQREKDTGYIHYEWVFSFINDEE